MESFNRPDQAQPRITSEDYLDSLLNLGQKGVFPLFFDQWITEVMQTKNLAPSLEDSWQDAEELASKLSLYQNLEKQRTFLMALNPERRKSFIQSFFRLVESRVLEKGIEIQ